MVYGSGRWAHFNVKLHFFLFSRPPTRQKQLEAGLEYQKINFLSPKAILTKPKPPAVLFKLSMHMSID